jgi:hypothetical protein
VGADGNYELVYFNEAYFDVPQNDGWLDYLWNKTITSRAIRRAYLHRLAPANALCCPRWDTRNPSVTGLTIDA